MNLDVEARAIKNHLRFIIGTVVFMKSDAARLCPMTVTRYVLYEDETDYSVSYVSAFGGIQTKQFLDQALTE